MARPTPKPAALKLIEGRGPGRDSGGREVKAPPPFRHIAPDKPTDLSHDAAELWDQIISELSRLDIVREIDGASLRACVESYARYREAVRLRQRHGLTVETSQGEGVAPWVRVEESAGREFRAWCHEFGLTPSAEMKLATNRSDSGGEEGNPFAS